MYIEIKCKLDENCNNSEWNFYSIKLFVASTLTLVKECKYACAFLSI